MSKVKFKLNRAGVRALMKSDDMKQICMRYAMRIQQAAGPGYEVEERTYPERVGAAVFPGDSKAYFDNLENNTLEKARRSV